jgi:hypothetical protein
VIYEAMAAALVALAVLALIAGPLLKGGAAAPVGVDEPEELEETPKGIALAALKEIEFDRATGKLSDGDYQALKVRYTAEALAVLRQDAAPAGLGEADAAGGAPHAPLAGASPGPAGDRAADDPVEAMIAERVKTLQAAAIRCPACGPRPEGDALFCSACGRSLAVGGCNACGAPLVPGSRFCEGCGSAVGGEIRA